MKSACAATAHVRHFECPDVLSPAQVMLDTRAWATDSAHPSKKTLSRLCHGQRVTVPFNASPIVPKTCKPPWQPHAPTKSEKASVLFRNNPAMPGDPPDRSKASACLGRISHVQSPLFFHHGGIAARRELLTPCDSPPGRALAPLPLPAGAGQGAGAQSPSARLLPHRFPWRACPLPEKGQLFFPDWKPRCGSASPCLNPGLHWSTEGPNMSVCGLNGKIIWDCNPPRGGALRKFSGPFWSREIAV